MDSEIKCLWTKFITWGDNNQFSKLITTRFLTWGVFECDIAHRRSVTVLCMHYKIRCNPMHHPNGALPVPYMCQCTYAVPCMVAYWYTYATPRCRTSQYCRTFIPLSVSLWNDLADLYSTVWGWRVSTAEPTVLFYCPKLLYPSLSSTIFPFLFFLSMGGIVWLGLLD